MTKEEFVEKADQFEKTNDWQSALSIYEKLEKDYPCDITIMDKLAWCASRNKNYDVAIKYYTLLSEMQPQSAKWLYCIGYQYYMQKEWKTSNIWFEKALLQYPEYFVVKYRYAYSLRQICGDMMVLKKEEYWKALTQLSECDKIWNDYNIECQKQNENTYAAICFQHAKLLIERNHIKEAVIYLNKSLTIKPNAEEYQYQLSKSYLALGEIENAKSVFPSTSQKYFVKELEIDILVAEHKHTQAIEKCKSLLRFRKKDYLYRNLAMQYYEINNQNEAISCIIQAEKINSSNHLTQFSKGLILFKAGFLIAAENALELAASIKKAKYSSEYLEALELRGRIQQQICAKSYSSDDIEALKSFINQQLNAPVNQRINGKVSHYNPERGYGFIESNNLLALFLLFR